MQIPHSRATISQKDVDEVVNQLRSGLVASGEVAQELFMEIRSFHGYLNNKGGVTVSGSQALLEILKAMGVSTGDEIIVSTYVCQDVLHAIRSVGAKPVLHDIDQTWRPRSENISPLISRKTKAIVLVHIFGIDASFDGVNELGLPVIDDLCQSFGLQPSHNSRDAAFFSFNGTKFMTTGEGGAFAIGDSISSELKYESPRLALSDFQSALGSSQFRQYGAFLAARKRIAECFLENFPNQVLSRTREIADRTNWFRFPITSKMDFDDVRNEYERNGISVRRGVDQLNHDETLARLYPGAEECFRTTVSVPIYPSLSDREIERICMVTQEVFAC